MTPLDAGLEQFERIGAPHARAWARHGRRVSDRRGVRAGRGSYSMMYWVVRACSTDVELAQDPQRHVDARRSRPAAVTTLPSPDVADVLEHVRSPLGPQLLDGGPVGGDLLAPGRARRPASTNAPVHTLVTQVQPGRDRRR